MYNVHVDTERPASIMPGILGNFWLKQCVQDLNIYKLWKSSYYKYSLTLKNQFKAISLEMHQS